MTQLLHVIVLITSLLLSAQGCGDSNADGENLNQEDQVSVPATGTVTDQPADSLVWSPDNAGEGMEALEEYKRLQVEEVKPVIALEKTWCFGACPVFKLEIYPEGFVFYEGTANVDITGRYYGHTPEAEMQEVIAKAQEIDFFSMKAAYDAEVTDLPSEIFTITADGVTKTVMNRYGGPESLDQLDEAIMELFARITLTPLPEDQEPDNR